MALTLKDWRLSEGWSQKELADKLKAMSGEKVGQTHISAYERGSEPGWSIGLAISILTHGKVTPASFFERQ